MRDYSLYLTEFSKFIDLLVGSGRVPGESDVDYFVEKMWTLKYWAYDNNDFSGSSTFKGVQGFDAVSGKVMLDTEGLSYADYLAEAKPMLMERLQQSIGEITSNTGARMWETTPTAVERLAYMYAKKDGVRNWSEMERKDQRNSEQWHRADAETNYIKQRINEYNQKVIRYQLRKTMYHNLSVVHYSTSTGKCFVPTGGRGMRVNGEEEIEEFIDKWVTEAYRGLWFSFSDTGENYKAGVVDIDFHHLDMSDKEKKRVTREVVKRLQAAGYPTLIQFTGHGYHVWFGRGTGPEFTDRHVMNNSIARALGNIPDAHVDPSGKGRTKAVAEGLVHIELEAQRDHMWGMYFGLHYKPNDRKKIDEDTGFPPVPGTGLARVPLTLDMLKTFDPFQDAHPENVMVNFDKYARLVDNFFDEVEIGYGHEGPDSVGAQPPCERSEDVLPDHPLAVATTEWKAKPKFTEIRWTDALEFFEDKEDFTVSPKFNGTLCAIHYKERGGHKVDGKVLSRERPIVSRTQGGATLREPVTTIMSTKGGVVLWDNHITREFADTCAKMGISEALFVGELFEYDAFGVVRGPQAITAVIMRKDIDPVAFKSLRYSLIDVVKSDNMDSSFEYRLRNEYLQKFAGDRVKVVDCEYISEGAGPRLQALWNLHVGSNRQEGLVIHHQGKRYKIKEKYTIDAVIIGVNMASASWLKGRKNRHKFHLAVARETKYGDPTYIHIGPVNWGPGWDNEKQAELFEKVMGDNNSNALPDVSKAITDMPFLAADVLLVEPKVVVEVEYQRLSEGSTPTFGTYFRQETKAQRGPKRPDISGYRMYPQILQSRRLIGPALIMREREDKDPLMTHDIRAEQAEGAGGLEIKRAVKKNPVAVWGYPKWLQNIADLFPIVPSMGAPLQTALICDDTMSSMKFRSHPDGFPRSHPWAMSMEAYRKLWNFAKRSGRKREFGGYCKDGNIYYGTSQGLNSINMWLTSDVMGADFVFHTHPRNDFKSYTYPMISGHDLAASLSTKYTLGVPWEVIVAPFGFVFYCAKALRKGSPILKAIKALKENQSEKAAKAFQKVKQKEQGRIIKAYNNARKRVNAKQRKRPKNIDVGTDHPSWYEMEVIDSMNESGDCDVMFDYVFMPLYMVGPNFRKKKWQTIKSNPSTGYFGVAVRRDTLGSGVVGPDGEPMPASISLLKEFDKAFARGRTGEPGYKLYEAPYKIQRGQGYPFILGLPISMQLDFTDLYGGPGATSVARLGSAQGEIRSYTEQLNMRYRDFDPAQGKNDNALITIQSFRMPKKEDPNVGGRRDVPTIYDEGSGKRKGKMSIDMDRAQKGNKFTGSEAERLAHLRTLYSKLGVMTNPPTDIEEWDTRIAEYRKDKAMYDEQPSFQSWAEFALSKYPEWEFPLLEKGRMLAEAIEQYTLTDEEEIQIRQEYSTMTLDLANPLGNLLSTLSLEDDEEDEDGDEDYDGAE